MLRVITLLFAIPATDSDLVLGNMSKNQSVSIDHLSATKFAQVITVLITDRLN